MVGSTAHKRGKIDYIALHHMLLNNKAIMSLDKKVIKAVLDTAHFRSSGVPIKTVKPRCDDIGYTEHFRSYRDYKDPIE